MSKWAVSGIISIVIGGVILVFQLISGIMGESGSWTSLCLVDLFDPSSFNWIDHMTFLHINNLLDRIVIAPLYILLLCLGAVLLIISGFKKS